MMECKGKRGELKDNCEVERGEQGQIVKWREGRKDRIFILNVVLTFILENTRWTKPVGSVKQAQDQAGYCKKSERAMGVSPPTGLCQEN